MSERLLPPQKPRQWGKKSLSVVLGGVLLTGCTSTEAAPIPPAPSAPKAAASTPQHNVCKPLNQEYVQGRAKNIQNTIQSQLLRGRSSATYRNSRQWAEWYKLEVTDVQPTIDKLWVAKNTSERLQVANKFTDKKFGFTFEVADDSNPENITRDMGKILLQLEDIPVSLVKAVDLDKIILESPEPGKKVPPMSAFATPGKKYPNNIVIGPKNGYTFTHEFSHYLHYAYLENFCSTLVNYEDTEYAAANPPGFAYSGHKQEPMPWKGITFEKHGARTVREDAAITATVLLEQQRQACKDIAFSETLAQKIAMTAMHMNLLAPNAGDYAMNYFMEKCPVATFEITG
jgi:hypothetical protein